MSPSLLLPSFSTDPDRWRAVQTRDASADGVFLYGVRTTRIYCRPNCKARLARRANVVFFAGPAAAAEAEKSGFRACKRCRPQSPGVMPEEAAVVRIRRLLAAARKETAGHEMTSPSLSSLASQAGVSRWHFHRIFKQLTGQTPRAYQNMLQQRNGETGRMDEQLADETIHNIGMGSMSPGSEDQDLFALLVNSEVMNYDWSWVTEERPTTEEE